MKIWRLWGGGLLIVADNGKYRSVPTPQFLQGADPNWAVGELEKLAAHIRAAVDELREESEAGE